MSDLRQSHKKQKSQCMGDSDSEYAIPKRIFNDITERKVKTAI